VALLKSRKALTGVPERPRSETTTLVKEVSPLPAHRDCMRCGTYRDTLIMATNERTLKLRASVGILLCMILYFTGGVGLLAD
jgi:hypothetical protein